MSKKQLDEAIAAAREANDDDTARLVLIIRDSLNDLEDTLLRIMKEGAPKDDARCLFATRTIGTVDLHLSALARVAIHSYRIRNAVRVRLRETLKHLDAPVSA